MLCHGQELKRGRKIHVSHLRTHRWTYLELWRGFATTADNETAGCYSLILKTFNVLIENTYIYIYVRNPKFLYFTTTRLFLAKQGL